MTEVAPAMRREVDGWLERRRLEWPPGRTFVVRDDAARTPAAVARLSEPDPGDGYHREHVRLLRVAGARAALARVAREAAAAAGPDLRLEAEMPAAAAEAVAALRSAGVEVEARLPAGHRTRAGPGDYLLLGRPAQKRRGSAPPVPSSVSASAPPFGDLQLLRHDESSRPRLAAFLRELSPGRSYPPGTLLSAAELDETRRPGGLDADWLLAVAGDGRVTGGLVFEHGRGSGRRHVRRLHLDVLRDHRGRGIATALVRRARQVAAATGWVLEADPREGNVAALRALAAGGLARVGVQRAAWRMRCGGAAWDEDVILLSWVP